VVIAVDDQSGGRDGDDEEIHQGELPYERSMADIFNHSWRVERGSSWVWIPKPITVGTKEYPA
jgi:hypothetical protein